MAKQFKFRLESILKLRRMAEDEKKRAVAELVSEINQYQQEALDMAETIRKSTTELTPSIQGRVNLQEVARVQGYVGQLQRGINQRIENVARVQQKLGLARQDLAEAVRRTRILEKLKEKQKKQYMDELKRQENRALDEMATLAYVHGSKR